MGIIYFIDDSTIVDHVRQFTIAIGTNLLFVLLNILSVQYISVIIKMSKIIIKEITRKLSKRKRVL